MVALAGLCGCGPQTTPTTTAEPAAAATTPPSPSPFASLNVGFEEAATPVGWDVARSDYAATIDDDNAFEGEHSLRLTHDGIHTSGFAKLDLPIEAVRGRRVRVQAQVRAEGVTRGRVGIRVTARSGDDELARQEPLRWDWLTGTADWKALTAEIDVPPQSDQVTLTLAHSGSGDAWFDAIELSVEDTPPNTAAKATPAQAPTAATNAVEPPPESAVQWIREHAVPLRTVEAGHGLDDMAALDPMFANATVVGLGEATHGTREFFQMKHRMLEYLVDRHGFRVFAIEANLTECRAIDDYVQTGKGDPREALDGIYFWTWNTHEVLALVEWMRAYNVAHPSDRLHFVGIDAQVPDVAARNVAQYIEALDVPAEQRAAVAFFGRPWNREAYGELSKGQRQDTLDALDALDERFGRDTKALAAATSAEALRTAREDLTIVRQAAGIIAAPGMTAFAVRDRAMADNVLALRERFGPKTKVALWAHNGHVARAWERSEVMGQYLGQALGEHYVSMGFSFDRGGFTAIAIEGNMFAGLREHVVGPARANDFAAALRPAGPLFAVDLRTLPRKGDAATWLRAPAPMRSIGAGFVADDDSSRVVESAPERFDVMLFVEETTRSRPLRPR